MKLGDLDTDSIANSIMSMLTHSYSIHLKKVSENRYITYDFYGNRDVYTNDTSMDNITITKDDKFLYYTNNSSNNVRLNLVFEKDYALCGEQGDLGDILNKNKNLEILASYSHRDGKNIQAIEYIDISTKIEYFYLYIGSMLELEQINIEGDNYISILNQKTKIENQNEYVDNEIHIVDENNPDKILQIIKDNKRYFPTNKVLSKNSKYEDFVSVATQNPFLKYKQTFESFDGEYLNIYEDLYDENVDKTSKNIVQKTKKYKTKRKNIPILGNPKGWRRRWNVVKRFVRKRAVQVKDVAVEVYRNPIQSVQKVGKAIAKAATAVWEKTEDTYTKNVESIKSLSRTLTAKVSRNKVFDQLGLPEWTKVAYYRTDSTVDEDGISVREKYGDREGGFYIILEKMTSEEISVAGGVENPKSNNSRFQAGAVIFTDATYDSDFLGYTNFDGGKIIELIPINESAKNVGVSLSAFTDAVSSSASVIGKITMPKIPATAVVNSGSGIKGTFDYLFRLIQDALNYFNRSSIVQSAKTRLNKSFVPSLKGLNLKLTGDGKIDSNPVVFDEAIKKEAKFNWDIRTWPGKLWEQIKKTPGWVFLIIFSAAAVIGLSWLGQEPRDVENILGVPYYVQCKYCYCNQPEQNGDLCNSDQTPKFQEGEDELYASEPCITTVEENCETDADGNNRFTDENGDDLPNRIELIEQCIYCRRCMLGIDECTVEQTMQRMGLGEWLSYAWGEFLKAPTSMQVYWVIYLLTTFVFLPLGFTAFVTKAFSFFGSSNVYGIFAGSFLLELALMISIESVAKTPANFFLADEGASCRSARQCKNNSRVCYGNRYYQVSPFCLQNYFHCTADEKRYLYQKLDENDGANQVDKVLNYPQITDINENESQAEIFCSLKNNCEIFSGHDNNVYKFSEDIKLKPGGYEGNIYDIHFGDTTDNQLEFIIEVVSSANIKQVLGKLFEITSTIDDDPIVASLDQQLNPPGDDILIVDGFRAQQAMPEGYINETGKWLKNYVGRKQKREEKNSLVGRTLQFKVKLDTNKSQSEDYKSSQIQIKIVEGRITTYENDEQKTNVESEIFSFNIDLSKTTDSTADADYFQFPTTINVSDTEGGETQDTYTTKTQTMQKGAVSLYTKYETGHLILTYNSNGTEYAIGTFPDPENTTLDYNSEDDTSRAVIDSSGKIFGILIYKKNNSKFSDNDMNALNVWGDTKFYAIKDAGEKITQIGLTTLGEFFLVTESNNNISIADVSIEVNEEGIVNPYYSDVLLIETDNNGRSLKNRCTWMYTGKAKVSLVAAISKSISYGVAERKRDEYVKEVLSRIDEYKDYKNNFNEIQEESVEVNIGDLNNISSTLNTLRYSVPEDVLQRDEGDKIIQVAQTGGLEVGEEEAFIDLQSQRYYDTTTGEYVEQHDDIICDSWKLESGDYIPATVPSDMINFDYLNFFIGPTEEKPGTTVNPKLISDDDYVIIETYSTSGVSIRKKTYDRNVDDEGNLIRSRVGPESISNSDVDGTQSALFSIELPNYYFDEVVKGNWNFGDKIVIDTTNERAYYRDSISVNEKIILLTDPAFGFAYPLDKITAGKIDRNNQEIFIQTSITAPFRYVVNDKSSVASGGVTQECRILKVMRVDSEGNPYPGGWDTNMFIEGVFYYPRINSESDNQDLKKDLDNCQKGNNLNTVGTVNQISEETKRNGNYKFHLITFKYGDNEVYHHILTSKDNKIELSEITENTDENGIVTTTETEYTQISIGVVPTEANTFSIANNSTDPFNLLKLRVYLATTQEVKKFKFTYNYVENTTDLNIFYYDSNGIDKIYTNYPKNIEFDLSFSNNNSSGNISGNSTGVVVTQPIDTTSAIESPNILQQGEQEDGSYYGSFVSIGQIVGSVSATLGLYGTLSKLVFLPKVIGQRINVYGDIFGSSTTTTTTSKKSKSVNLYSQNNIEVTKFDLTYEFFGYMKIPATIIQFKIDIQKGDFVLFYINDSYIIDTGFYQGTTFESKKENGGTISYISYIQNYNEMVTMLQYKLFFVKRASNSKGVKIYWRYANNEANIEIKSFEAIPSRAFRLNDVGYEFVISPSNSQKIQGLLYNIYDLQIIDNAYYKGDIIARNKETKIEDEFRYEKDWFNKEKPAHSELIEVGSSSVYQKGVYLPYPHMNVEIDEASLTTGGKPILHWVNSWNNCGGIPRDYETLDNYNDFTVGKSVAQWGCDNYRESMEVVRITVAVPGANSFKDPPVSVGAGGIYVVEPESGDTKNNYSLEVDNYKLIVSNNYGFTGKWDYNLIVKASTRAGEYMYAHFIGYLKSPLNTNSLKLRAVSDDGVIVSFDGNEIISDWSPHGSRPTESGNLTVNEDYYYLFEVQHFQGHGGAYLSVEWNVKDGKIVDDWSSIPNENFYYISGMNDQNMEIGRNVQAEELRKSVAKGGKIREPKKASYLQGYLVTSYVLDRLGGSNRASPKEIIRTKIIINKNIDYNWGGGWVFGLRQNNIYNVFEGFINIPKRKEFKFAVKSDDGVRLFFDSEIVLDDWGDHGMRWRESKSLKKNDKRHSFRMEHYEAGGGAGIKLYWNINGKWEIVPTKEFYLKNDLSTVQFLPQEENIGIKRFEIQVGGSRGNSKTINLSYDNVVVSPIPLNEQGKKWTDRFKTKVQGRKLTVTRIDSKSGWGQDLRLEGRTQTNSNKKLININNKTNYTSGTNVNIYELLRDRKTGERLRWNLMGKTSIRQEINFNWNSRTDVKINGIGRRDNVYIEMFGVIKIPEKINGVRRDDLLAKFQIGSDDGSRLFFDDKLVIDNWRDQGYRRKTSGFIPVTAGSYHQFKLEYYEATGDARLTFEWNMTQTNFNWKEYTTMYPDVKHNWREYPYYEHFKFHGKNEGRLSGGMKIIPKENLFRFGNSKLTLDNLHNDAQSETGEFEIIRDTWTRPKFNTILSTGGFKSIFTFRMKFEIRPLGTKPVWSSVLAMKLTDKNYGVEGARWPGIWFYRNSTRFHIVCGGNSRERYNASINPKEHLTLNKVHYVTIERNISTFKVFLQIQNEDNSYSDTREYVKTCEGLDNSFINKIDSDLKFYFSDKYHTAADCEVKNLRLEML